MKKDFLPVIIGSDENAYGMARAFHEKYNIRSLILCRSALIPTRYSGIVDIRIFDGFDDSETFIAKLIEVAKQQLLCYEKLLLIPCADRYTELAVSHRERISEFFCNPFITPGLLEKFITKDKFYALCEEHSLPYPKTILCGADERLSVCENLPFDYPIIVKADNSNSYDFLHAEFEGKKKVYYVKSKDEFLQIIDRMNRANYRGKLIIQEFIPGDDTSMRVMNCYSDRDGRVRLMSLGRPILEEYAPSTLGNYAAILSDYDAELYELIKEFLEKIGYVGFSNFDLKYDRRSGKYVLFEINPRQGRSSFFTTSAGYNLAEFLTEDAVYNQPHKLVLADVKDKLWLTIPRNLLLKYVENPEIVSSVRRSFAANSYSYTLLYKRDLSLLRRIRMWRFYRRQRGLFKRYFFKKEM